MWFTILFWRVKLITYIHNIIKVMRLSDTKYNYMDSLILIRQGENFDNAIKSFIIDLVEEGFEVNDVREFVNERVENIFKDFKNY